MFPHREPVVGMRGSRRPSLVFLAIVAVLVGSGWLLWAEIGSVGVAAFLVVVSSWLVSLCLHEYGHALLAYRFGDAGVADRGYLTLNPLKYSNVFLSIVLPVLFVLLGGIGLPGGAVWVDRGAIRGKLRHSLISAAGPLINVVFTLVLGLAFAAAAGSAGSAAGGPGTIDPTGPGAEHSAFWAVLAFACLLQASASLLNLLPVPGLDGYGVAEPWLPDEWRRAAGYVAPYGLLIVFALLWDPRINNAFFSLVFWLVDALGVDPAAVAAGDGLFRFWS